jgi:phage terminase small subunit
MEKQMQPKKVNVSINPDTMYALSAVRLKLSQELGFTPSYSQVIQHLLKQTDNAVEILTNEGDANE